MSWPLSSPRFLYLFLKKMSFAIWSHSPWI
jgi:hypothetical protein